MRVAIFVLAAGLALLPAGTRAAGPPKPPGDGRDADVEALKKEVGALRERVEALERQKRPDQVRQKVVVTSPQAKDVTIARRYAARIRAHRHIDVCALANGVIAEVAVTEGQAVKKGDVLFKVLPTLYKAKLDAELAEVRIAKVELDNTKKLFDQKVVSQLELTLHEAKLAKAEARAKLAEAELAFTVVRAPFDGLVGRLRQQEGSLVKEGDVLTTLSDNSAVWVYFDVPEARYLEYAADRDRVKVGTPLELVMANGDTYPEAGTLGAVEAGFDNDTGTIPFRGDFPNPKGLLRHGQTGAVLIRESLKNAVLIPRRATFEDGGKRYVYVVGKDDAAHRREVVVRSELDDLFVVGKGLDVTDRIVVEGVRQLRDGEKVAGYEYRKPEERAGDPGTRPEK
jgi:membrane fusion protein (multidrug efflux system)